MRRLVGHVPWPGAKMAISGRRWSRGHALALIGPDQSWETKRIVCVNALLTGNGNFPASGLWLHRVLLQRREATDRSIHGQSARTGRRDQNKRILECDSTSTADLYTLPVLRGLYSF
jgi:hypothetical protein